MATWADVAAALATGDALRQDLLPDLPPCAAARAAAAGAAADVEMETATAEELEEREEERDDLEPAVLRVDAARALVQLAERQRGHVLAGVPRRTAAAAEAATVSEWVSAARGASAAALLRVLGAVPGSRAAGAYALFYALPAACATTQRQGLGDDAERLAGAAFARLGLGELAPDEFDRVVAAVPRATPALRQELALRYLAATGVPPPTLLDAARHE